MEEKKFRAWNRSFDTPEDLYEKMLEYIDWVEGKNAPHVFVVDTQSGIEYNTYEEALNDGASPDDLQRELIRVAPEDKTRPSMYGFAAFCSLGEKTLWHYAKKGGEFKDVVSWFKNILQADLEQILLNPFTKNVGGAKFVAINNYGWKEKSEVEHLGAQPVTFVNDLDDVEEVVEGQWDEEIQ